MDYDILVHILDGREKPTNLPFALLKNMTDNFSEDRVIGQGGFAIVYKGVLPNGSVAVKRIRNNHTIDEKLFYREVDSLLSVNHENVVRFLGFCASTEQGVTIIEGSRLHQYFEIRERLLCFEYIINGNLENHITDELRGLEWNMRYQIIKGICEGLHHLHKEKRIYHMDLKPANILMDDHMVPKITDFGLSRLDEKSQTMSETRCGSLRYCAPEYKLNGKMSFRSDMFSLGIIITELVTGDKGIPDMNTVLRRWRHRWKKTGKETPLVYHQVAKCMEIGILCQEIDASKRPFIWDLIHDIREMDNGPTSNAYTFGQISPYSEDDMLGVEPLELHFPFELNKQISSSLKLTNHTDAYIAFTIQKMSPLPYSTHPNKGIVPPRSSCSVGVTLHPQDKAPRDMKRADELIVRSTKVNDGLAAKDITINMFSTESGVVDGMNLDVVFDAEESTKVSKEIILHSITEDMSNIKIDGTVRNVKNSQECLLSTTLWTSSTGSSNNQEAAKMSSETQQASKKPSEMEAHEELSTYMQYTDELLILNTIEIKDLATQSISREMFINKTDGEVADESKSDESLSPTPTLSESIIGNQYYQEGAQVFSEPQSARDTITEIKVIPVSSTLLDVHPLELCFRFEPNKLMACSLDLTNNTDEHVAFGLVKKSGQMDFSPSLPMFGIVDPRTTYTLLVVTMKRYENLPDERNVDLILQTVTCSSAIPEDKSMYMQHFQNAKELGNIVHNVTLEGVCALQGEMIFESIPPSVKVISVEECAHDSSWGGIRSIDANQIEPLIITGHYSGHVRVWNYDTQKSMGPVVLLKLATAVSVKFIARQGWFLVASDDGFIHVYNYKKNMQKITSFKAHSTYVLSLAIHPTKTYVLSASTTEIKLWDWDQGWFGWKHMRTFKEHSGSGYGYGSAVAFNPEDYNSFGASNDRTIKVWSLDSPKSKYTLSGHSSRVESLDFFTRDGQQYLISGSYDETAKIWDMQEKKCVCTLPHRSVVLSVLPHPKLPLLVTGTRDGDIYFWSSTSFRLERILEIGSHLWIGGLACLNESGRVAILHDERLSVIEIRDEEEGEGCSNGNGEDSISTTD